LGLHRRKDAGTQRRERAIVTNQVPDARPDHAVKRQPNRRENGGAGAWDGVVLAGLDEHQVCTRTSWHRWATFALLACAFLTVAAASEYTRAPAPDGQIPLIRDEIARLLTTLITRPAHGPRHRLPWSAWRRRHQYRARTCHYQRQAREP
jgi:hypothetical protein